MPKISQERLLARRRGIVQAAARCLQRNGLQATGMRDLFRAANLSPGAVYRYFSSKDELIAAVAAATPGVSETALAGMEEVVDLNLLLHRLLSQAAAAAPPAQLQLELQVAGLRSPLIAAALAERRIAERHALAAALRNAGGAPDEEVIALVMATCEALARHKLLEPSIDVPIHAAERALLACVSRQGPVIDADGPRPPA